jgi:hypothetical protein
MLAQAQIFAILLKPICRLRQYRRDRRTVTGAALLPQVLRITKRHLGLPQLLQRLELS